MKKLKASKLLEELLINFQKAFSSEDKQIIEDLKVVDLSTLPDYEAILKIVNINNEFIKMSIIKTTLLTLIQHNIIENDISSSEIDNIKNAFETALKKCQPYE